MKTIVDAVPLDVLVEAAAENGTDAWCGHWRCGSKLAANKARTYSRAHYSCVWHRQVESRYVMWEPVDWHQPEDELRAIPFTFGPT